MHSGRTLTGVLWHMWSIPLLNRRDNRIQISGHHGIVIDAYLVQNRALMNQVYVRMCMQISTSYMHVLMRAHAHSCVQSHTRRERGQAYAQLHMHVNINLYCIKTSLNYRIQYI